MQSERSNSSSKTKKLIKTCSIWRALEIVGDTPTLLILEAYWLGERRFDGFCKQTGLLKTVVSDRLKRLINNNCLVKIAYCERPRRYEYKATEQLIDFHPLALAMLHWERTWNRKPGKISVTLTHTHCGNETNPIPVCKCCRTPIDPRQVAWKTGPGVGYMEAEYSRRRRQSAATEHDTRLFDEIIQVIGNRWATLILRSLFSGINQYQEILQDTAMATNILSDRLAELCQNELVVKIPVPEDSRKVQYKLTEKGMSIYPILLTLLQWGDRWRPAPEGPPLLLTHTTCGNPLELEMACSVCDTEMLPADTQYRWQ